MDPEVYLKAAENLFKLGKEYERMGTRTIYLSCCGNIGDIVKFWEVYFYTNRFAEYFKPENSCIDGFWWENPYNSKIDQEARIIALLLMYEITKGIYDFT